MLTSGESGNFSAANSGGSVFVPIPRYSRTLIRPIGSAGTSPERMYTPGTPKLHSVERVTPLDSSNEIEAVCDPTGSASGE